MPRFGHPWHFAIEVEGPHPTSNILHRVDLWAARQLLTCDDHWAFVSQFCRSLEHAIGWLLNDPDVPFPWPDLSPAENHRRLLETNDHRRQRHRFLDWGPTTDNVAAFLFLRDRDAIITFEFGRPTHHKPEDLGHVFVAELPERELLRVLHAAASYLRQMS